MLENAVIFIRLEAYVAFLALLAFVLAVLYWSVHKRRVQERDRYFSKFDHAQLRMSRYQIGIVYLVVQQDEHSVAVRPIWNSKAKILSGQEINLSSDDLIPFDPSRFA